jgi:hypothetical protein
VGIDTVTVRTTPPLAPSRAMAKEIDLTTNFCINANYHLFEGRWKDKIFFLHI